MITTYEFDISLSEGIEPSEISDLKSVISKFTKNESFEFMPKPDCSYGFYSPDNTLCIKLNISKYYDKYYMIELRGILNSFGIPETEIYSFVHSLTYKMYENKIVNKYILYIESDKYIPEMWYAIGNLDLPPLSSAYNDYTINWIVYPLLVQISLNKDYEMMDTLFGNMNPKYFEKIKNTYYDEIMNLSNNNPTVALLNEISFSDEDFKICFIHWCNHYAAMNDDEDIML